MSIFNLSDEQIHEIAERIDADEICYINVSTGEIIFMMNDEMLSDYGISWEDENENFDSDCPDWQKDMYAKIKTDMNKIYSWGCEDTIRIEKPEAHEAFKFMESFVENVIPEGKLKQKFWNALSKKHPFRNFNDIVHDCEYRENWFEFKQNALECYVKDFISFHATKSRK